MGFPVYIKAGASRVSIAKEIREVSRLRLQFEKQMARKMESLFRTAGNRAAAAYEAGTSVNDANATLQSEVGAVFRASYAAVIEKFAQRVVENRKRATQFEGLVFQYYAKEGASKVVGVTQTTKNKIRRAIEVADKEALGVGPTAKLIKEYTGGAMGRARATTIARTETHAAASYATDAATRELNLPSQKKRWVSVSDARTRSGHAAANGQEVGIDEPFLVPFNGQTVEMKYPHDGSGGAGNNINCRCLAVYFTDEDAIFDDVPVASPPPPPPPPAPFEPFAPLPVGREVVLPIIKGVRNEDFPTVSKEESLASLRKQLKEADEQPNQALRAIYQGRSANDFAAIQGAASLTKEAATAMAIVNQELNYFADLFGIPRVRGYKKIQSGSTIADMGDGVMGFNTDYFNKWGGDINTSNDATLVPRRAELKGKIQETEARVRSLEQSILETGDRGSGPLSFQLSDANDELWKLKREYASISTPEVTDYKLGGEGRKPWTVEKYSTGGMDYFRSTMYHEFGHQIHQTYGRRVSERGRVSASDRPFEDELKKRWLKVYRLKKKRSKEFASRYAETSAFEWFAESFALWASGQTDKVNPLFLEMIQEIIDDAKRG
jgi:hypothetical protein